MTRRARLTVLLFAITGLGVSAWATIIHHRLIGNAAYVSPCDLNARFNCSQVYLSPYGMVAGVPVAFGGVIWFTLVALVAGLVRPPRDRRPDASGSYLFVLALIGLGTIAYLAYTSFFVLGTWCVLCLATYVCVMGIFLIAFKSRTIPMRQLPARIVDDVSTLTTRPAVIAIVILFVLGVGYAIATLSRAFERVAAAPAMTSVASTDASSPADPRRAFEEAWAKQPRVDLGVPAGHARVVVVKFLDWQCPACKLTDEWYRPVLAHFETLAPGDVTYVEKDFPLDPSCNFAAGGRVHPAPCDAAAAVRLATTRGKREEMIQWNFANQRATSAAIRTETQALLGLTNVDQEFASVLRAIREDVSDAAALRVHGTPTIFINGVECPAQALPPAYFQMAIEYELRTAGGGR
jgi:uncharacterized membrane protein/protein-disulfide isomerase